MIRTHAFNSQWWDGPVGIVTDSAFFSLPLAEQSSLLGTYAWVEFKCPLDSAPGMSALQQSGFFWVDTQVHFRINLSHVAHISPVESLSVHSAREASFTVELDAIKEFVYERYLVLPSMTAEKMNKRYVLWAKQLVGGQPDWCVRITSERGTEGWFLSELTDDGLNLALAMLHRSAVISGLTLYQLAMVKYSQKGAKIGHASFSIRNRDVLNIYAKLGAHFTKVVGHWIWISSLSPK